VSDKFVEFIIAVANYNFPCSFAPSYSSVLHMVIEVK